MSVPFFFTLRTRFIDPLVASSSPDERRQNYPTRNAKFTGTVHKNAVIPSACCEWWGGIGSCTYIVGAYCAREKTMRPIVSHDACGRPGKKKTKKKPCGQGLRSGLLQRYFSSPHLPQYNKSELDETSFPWRNYKHKNLTKFGGI